MSYNGPYFSSFFGSWLTGGSTAVIVPGGTFETGTENFTPFCDMPLPAGYADQSAFEVGVNFIPSCDDEDIFNPDQAVFEMGGAFTSLCDQEEASECARQLGFETGGADFLPCCDADAPPPPPVYGCTNPAALNFNPAATQDDGSCVLDGQALDFPFDFAVLRYRWSEQNGTDLDTRTAISSPPRFRDVGWQRYISDPGDAILPACQTSSLPEDLSGLCLVHGGDNCVNGVEAVLIDFKKLAEDFPDASLLVARLRAFWYSVRGDGDISIEFQTYLGGSMQHVGYDFANVGGVPQQNVFVQRNLTTDNVQNNVDGEECGTLRYDPATKQALIVNP